MSGTCSGLFGIDIGEEIEEACAQLMLYRKRQEKQGAKKGGVADKLNLSLVINPGRCSIKNEHQPAARAAAGKCPGSFCRTRAHEWGNAA